MGIHGWSDQKQKLTEIPTCPFVALGEIHPDYKVR